MLKRKVQKMSDKCLFCETDSVPDYKEADALKNWMTDRAKIIGSDRSGICSKHQRRLSVAVKRARHLGLLPFN